MSETVILLLGFNRPEKLHRRLVEIAGNYPTKLVISLDGGSSSGARSKMVKSVNNFKKQNPEFRTELILREQNLGLSKHITTAIAEVFEKFEYCIVLEDDVSISENFISTMIKSQKIFNISNAFTIGGFSPISGPRSKWCARNFFRETIYFSAWGWMTSAEKWKLYNLEIDLTSSGLSNSELWRKLNMYKKTTWIRRFMKIDNHNPSTWDYQMQYVTFVNNFTHLLPIYRICDNIGFNDQLSTHTSGRRPRWMGKEGRIDHRQILSEKWLKKNRLVGQTLNFLDSIFIAGDSKIVRINRILKEFLDK